MTNLLAVYYENYIPNLIESFFSLQIYICIPARLVQVSAAAKNEQIVTQSLKLLTKQRFITSWST